MEHVPEQAVLMEEVASSEYFLFGGERLRRVLDNITLLCRRGETWGIQGNSLFELKLLLEIMANIRPYDKGKCVLLERGMMRRKRVILSHVFYIGSPEMLYNNMNMLEFLMFAAANFKVNKVLLQEQIFEFILKMGLGHLSLTPIYLLTREEKAIVALIAAAYSESPILVFNFPEYRWDEVLVNAVAALAEFTRERGKTLVLAAQNCLLIERACSHTAILKDGRLIYSGGVENFRFDFDKIEIIIRDKAAGTMLAKLAGLLPGYALIQQEDSLLICRGASEVLDYALIYRKIAEAGLAPRAIEINPKTVQNAYEELLRRHDLQE